MSLKLMIKVAAIFLGHPVLGLINPIDIVYISLTIVRTGLTYTEISKKRFQF